MINALPPPVIETSGDIGRPFGAIATFRANQSHRPGERACPCFPGRRSQHTASNGDAKGSPRVDAPATQFCRRAPRDSPTVLASAVPHVLNHAIVPSE